MERIGYIYRYKENEGKGILVYGYNWDCDTNPTKPIKFSKTDCISEVRTGVLVYFILENNSSASHIERASLANFKRNIVSEIVSCYDTKDYNDCFRATMIRYENVEDTSFDDYFDDFDDYLAEKEGLPPIEHQEKRMPDSIDGLFAFFGTKGHYPRFGHDNSSQYVDILDIDQWVDNDIVKEGLYYGNNGKEVLDVFDLFINKRKFAYIRHRVRSVNSSKGKIDDSISPQWKLLLASLPIEDLIEICKQEPMLQPAIPDKFCMENIELLSIDYGFPNIDICEAYYRYRIGNLNMTSEYRFMLDMIHAATHCSGKHKENEGANPCQMGKKVLQELNDLLNTQYHTIVLKNVKQQLASLSDNKINGGQRVSFLLLEGNFNYLMKIGNYLDAFNGVLYNRDYYDSIRYDCDYYESFLHAKEAFDELMEEDKIYLNSSIKSKFKECVFGIANEHDRDYKAHDLCVLINNNSDYLASEDIEAIKRIVNSKFAILDDLEELDAAAKCGLISEEQHLKRCKEITKDYDIKGLLNIIEHNYYGNIPILTQTYLIKEILRRFDFKTLSSFKYVRIGNDAIANIESLIDWFNRQSYYGHVDAKIWGIILKETTDELSHEDRLVLYGKGLIQTLSL